MKRRPFEVPCVLEKRPGHWFSLVGEWSDEWFEASCILAGWISEDELRYRETIADGHGNAPAVGRGLWVGENLEKQRVELVDRVLIAVES